MNKVMKMFRTGSSRSPSSRPSPSSGSSSRSASSSRPTASSGSGSKASSRHRQQSQQSLSPHEAIKRLRETEDTLTKKQEYLESRIQQELAIARKNGTKNKRGALQALKRKKRLEQQLTQIDGTLSTIEFQREALENATTNAEVLKNMGYAAKAMKGVHQNIDFDKIDSLMQDVAEQREIAQEISDAISKPFGDEFDEDELLAELAELQRDDDLAEGMKNMARLPSAPNTKLPSTRPSHRAQTSKNRSMLVA